MEKVRAKAAQITSNSDMPSTEKMRQLDTLYKRASKKTSQRKSRSYVLGATGKRIGGSAKGKVKLVDRRMKKELRAAKRIEKRKGGKGKK